VVDWDIVTDPEKATEYLLVVDFVTADGAQERAVALQQPTEWPPSRGQRIRILYDRRYPRRAVPVNLLGTAMRAVLLVPFAVVCGVGFALLGVARLLAG
jgi:hypothetical protein